ncbi:Kinase, NEK [Giardia muris]|uniref:Kinase, NEK n=1 Tax=Giardia muris TaxID=5742 RepID=A0A4Z1ST67_GIAMU|nr:Kinase, NEK [Giardia muris]|eukprot:TNJ29132.1 Kinase, NEK [Giardia muris]
MLDFAKFGVRGWLGGRRLQVLESRADRRAYVLHRIELAGLSEPEKALLLADVATVARIHHRNVCRIFDYSVNKEEGMVFVLAELCGGGSLEARIAEARGLGIPFSSADIWDVIVQLLRAIGHIHRRLDRPAKRRPFLLHPSCLHFTDGGVLKVDLLTVMFVPIRGIERYAPPELQAVRFFTERTTIYTVGSIAHEMVACSFLEAADTRLTHEEICPIDTLDGCIPYRMAASLQYMCKANVRDRADSNAILDEIPKAITAMERRQNIIRDSHGSTRLMLACLSNSSSMARMHIYEAGLLSGKGLTALMLAALNNAPRAAKHLVHQEAFYTVTEFSLNSLTFVDATALMLAAAVGSLDVLKLLLPIEGGRQSGKGWTALMYAAGNHQIAAVHLLSACEARLFTNHLSRFGCGFTALMAAAYNGCPEACALLVKHEAGMRVPMENPNYPGWYALVFAAAAGNVECVLSLAPHEGAMAATLALKIVGEQEDDSLRPDARRMIQAELIKYTRCTTSILARTAQRRPRRQAVTNVIAKN